MRDLSEALETKALRRSLPPDGHRPRPALRPSLVAALAYLGALPRDGPGSAAQRALAVHATLPPWPKRRAVLTYPPIRCDAAPRPRDKTLRPMRDALNAELVRASEDGEGHNVLQLIARKLADKALEGDLGAIREIFDRIDGKTVAGSAPDLGALSDRCLRSAPEAVLRR